MSLEFLRPPDLWFWGLLLGVCSFSLWSIFKLWSIRQVRIPVLIRIGLFSLLLFTLLQPKITRGLLEENPLKWNVYTDNSMSMGYHQVYSLTTLNEEIKEILSKIKNKGTVINRFHFSSEVIPTDLYEPLNASGSSTDLGIVLNSIKEEEKDNLAGAILFTDGQITRGLDPVQTSSEIHVPIHIIGIGENTPLVDVALKSIDVPTVAIKGEDVEVTVVVVATGITANEGINITLSKERKILGSRFMRIRGDGVQSDVHFRFKPDDIGKITYQVQVSSLENEINIQNNRQSFHLTILKNRYRVALLTGAPNYNTSVLKMMMNNQPRIKIDHFNFTIDCFQPAIKKFWETPYDLIVLDNYPVQSISSQWQRFFAKKIVAQKTALAWIIGPSIDLLSAKSFFPFFHIKSLETKVGGEKYYQWAFNEKITNYPIFPKNNVPLNSIDQAELPPLKPGIQVSGTHNMVQSLADLLSPQQIPVLLIGEVESFRTVVWTTPDFHSLYYKLTGTKRAEIFAGIWNGILGWLMRTRGDNDMYFRLDKDSYQQGEIIKIMGNKIGQLSPESHAAITLHHEGKTINSTELRYNSTFQRWEGQLWASKPGSYDYEIVFKNENTISSQRGEFLVKESQIELNKVFLNDNLLRKISMKTGGNYFNWKSRHELIDHVDQRTITKRKVVHIEPHNEWWILLGFFILLTVEWSLRRRAGLM